MIRLLLVDDQILFVETLQTVINLKADDIDVVGLAYNGKQGVKLARELKPDIILMDVRMPELDGVQAAAIIHESMPEIKIMMLTTFDDDDYVHNALKGGALGYLLKNMPSEDLISSIRAVNSGTLQISPAVAAQLVNPHPNNNGSNTDSGQAQSCDDYNIEVLSRREREVLYLVSRGYDNSHIAKKLFLADQTVKNHISRIYHKLHIHDRMAAMKAARHSRLRDYCRYLLDDE